MIVRLAHLCFVTNQLEKMTAFYSNTLGLPVKFSFRNKAGEVFGRYFSIGETSFIEIFDTRDSAESLDGKPLPVSPDVPSTYKHLCLEVKGIEAMFTELTGKGVKVSPVEIGTDHSKQMWITDPDNNPIEFMEYTEKSLQLKPGI